MYDLGFGSENLAEKCLFSCELWYYGSNTSSTKKHPSEERVTRLSDNPCRTGVLAPVCATSVQCHPDASPQTPGPVLAQKQLCSFPLQPEPRACC